MKNTIPYSPAEVKQLHQLSRRLRSTPTRFELFKWLRQRKHFNSWSKFQHWDWLDWAEQQLRPASLDVHLDLAGARVTYTGKHVELPVFTAHSSTRIIIAKDSYDALVRVARSPRRKRTRAWPISVS